MKREGGRGGGREGGRKEGEGERDTHTETVIVFPKTIKAPCLSYFSIAMKSCQGNL